MQTSSPSATLPLSRPANNRGRVLNATKVLVEQYSTEIKAYDNSCRITVAVPIFTLIILLRLCLLKQDDYECSFIRLTASTIIVAAIKTSSLVVRRPTQIRNVVSDFSLEMSIACISEEYSRLRPSQADPKEKASWGCKLFNN